MFLKKRMIATAAVIAMAAAAVYGSTQEMSQTQDTGERLQLFRGKETIYCWYSDEALSGYINAAAVSFGEQNKVRVIPVLTSDSEYLEAVNQETLHSAQIPDIYLLSSDSLEKAYLAGLATKVPDTEGICDTDHFSRAALAAVTYDDKIIGYPVYFDTSALVYNEDYLRTWATQQAEKELSGSSDNDEPVGEGEEIIEEDSLPEDQTTDQVTADEATVNALAEQYFAKALPSTVDDLLNIADTFDAPEGVEGVMKWDVNNIFYNYWIVGNYMIVGSDPGDDRNDININNPETIQCLEVYKALNQFFFIESDTVTYDSVIQDFIDGKTMFTIGTTDVVKRLEDAKADSSLTFNYGIARMPDVSAELQSRSLSVTGAAVINGYSEHKELADRFAAYLSEEYADGLYERSGKMPASIHAAENADNGALTIFANEYADSVSLPKMLETGNFWMQLEVLFSKVWNGEDVTTLVQQLADNMSQQLGNTEN
jgi:arabinogalactan oligomer/maltooligosaccharide transport system substrate-binding protein